MKHIPTEHKCDIRPFFTRDECLCAHSGFLHKVYEDWKFLNSYEAGKSLELYCYFLALRGYGSEAETIFSELKSKSTGEAERWIEDTYIRYVPPNYRIIRKLDTIFLYYLLR